MGEPPNHPFYWEYNRNVMGISPNMLGISWGFPELGDTPNSWMVSFSENPINKWMIWRFQPQKDEKMRVSRNGGYHKMIHGLFIAWKISSVNG